MSSPTPSSLSFRSSAWMDLFAKGQHGALSSQFLEILQHFRQHTLNQVAPQDQYFIDQFVKWFLALFTEADFKVPEEHVRIYISSNHLIANLVAISEFRTTDAHLKILLPQQGNFVKILTLLNARCSTKVDRNIIFSTQADLASSWYAHYACAYYGALQCKTGYENLLEHFSFTHPNLTIKEQVQESYFGSTYTGSNVDQIVKPVVNRSVAATVAQLPVQKRAPHPKKVAVISGLWKSGTSVYRTYSQCIDALKSGYKLTLFPIYDETGCDTSQFEEVIPLKVKNNALDVSPLLNSDFQAVLYPDVGMIDASISLANMRLAPIQICLTGHPVSTFGAQTDYFISGADVEIPDRPERHYSERLVLIPGMGIVHNLPRYEFQGLKKENDVILINGLFWSQKINHPYIRTLRKLFDRIQKKARIRMFVGSSPGRCNDRVPFVRDLQEQLGADNVEVMPPLDYKSYMSEVERGDLTVDSYPFGGSNTTSDSLYARVPMVTWESDKWYGRIGSEMNRLAGLPECVATTEDEFLDITARLIDDDAYRAQVTAKLKGVDLDATIYNKTGAHYFRKAFDYLVKNHAKLKKDKSREPIRIKMD